MASSTLSKKQQSQSSVDKINELNNRVLALEATVNMLKFRNNTEPFKDKLDKIEDYAKQLFSAIPNIVRLSYDATPESFILIAVHKFEKTYDALRAVRNCIYKIEDKYPEIYFKPRLVHVSEVDSGHPDGSVEIFKR